MRTWYNSPTFAYIAVYGKEPDFWLRGRTNEPKKIWRGIEVDATFKDKWLDELNSIPQIEVRASDAGKNSVRVAFIVFRMKDPKDDVKAKKVSKILDKMPDIYSKCDIGAQNRPRVVVAGKTWYGQPDWERWWDSLAGKIRYALSQVSSSNLGSPDEKPKWGYIALGSLGAIFAGYLIYKSLKK